MINKSKYYFSDFTTKNYTKLVKYANEKYHFITFDTRAFHHKSIYWRHDVDFSMHRAYKLAQIEAELGIKTTYFVLLHSQFYNLLEPEVTDLVFKIINLGHNIGLHFDSHYYVINDEKTLNEKLIFEKVFLENLFKIKINVFSFHITNEFTNQCRNNEYGKMINVYSSYFQNNVNYCSDSNGYWRFDRLEDVLTKGNFQVLQVLTHPELWQDEVMSPKQRIEKCINGRANKTREWYQNVLVKYNRKDIDW